MADKLQVELCPETGICSLIRPDSSKIDLMPDEVEAIRTAAGNPDKIRQVLADCDGTFAAALAPNDLAHLVKELA